MNINRIKELRERQIWINKRLAKLKTMSKKEINALPRRLVGFYKEIDLRAVVV